MDRIRVTGAQTSDFTEQTRIAEPSGLVQSGVKAFLDSSAIQRSESPRNVFNAVSLEDLTRLLAFFVVIGMHRNERATPAKSIFVCLGVIVG